MRRAVAPLAVSFALALVPAARAGDAAALYDPAAVARIDLTLTPEAIAALTADPSTYVPATFEMQIGDDTFAARPAELKLKGHGTFRPIGKKAAFKLKFAKKDRFLGLKKLTLNNMVQDASMIHETLGYEVLRAAGVPAPRTGFAYVTVNGKGYGLYLDLEPYDDVSLAHLFPTTQHLYKPTPTASTCGPARPAPTRSTRATRTTAPTSRRWSPPPTRPAAIGRRGWPPPPISAR
jgi:hypothetical protein